MTLKLRCERNSLLSAVTNAYRAVAKQGPLLAALTGMYLKLDGDSLTLTGSDLDLTITVKLDVAGQASGETVIPAKLLLDVVRVMPVGSVDLTVTEDEARISAGSTEFTIRVLSVSDWPQLPSVDSDLSPELKLEDTDQAGDQSLDDSAEGSEDSDAGSYSVTTGGGVFRDALNQVVRSASTDETRPILTGILMSSEENGLRLVSTDSYRLSLRDLPGSNLLGKQQQVLVPGRALTELQRMMGDSGEMTLRLSAKRAEFEVGEIRLTARLIEGDFPNYRSLIPSSHPNTLRVQRSRLLEAVRRVRLLAQDSTPIRLEMKDESLEIHAITQDVGSAIETMEAEYTGEDMTVAFNPTYLVDGLEVSDTEEVTLELLDSLKPVLLRSVGNDSFLYLLMPVRVS